MKVGVLGAGAYGLALTHILVNNKVEVTMWTHDENERKNLDETRKSKKLNDYKIPNEIKFTCDLNEAVNDKDLIVMAIASGMLEGMGVTDSTRALFLTESMNDIKELIDALGGKKKSILSFAGFGDILMTCTSKNSRNFSFGYLIGSGATNEEVNKYLETTTVEGMYTLKSIHKLVRRKKVKMPIINLIHDIIEGKKDKEEMLKFLINK